MSCEGKAKRGSSTNRCGGVLYKCKYCGSAGCSSKDCTNKSFEACKCIKCGKQNGNLEKAK